MSKHPVKQEENLKNRIKNFLGIGERSTQVVYQRPQTKEIIFTPEILKDIGPESPANNRLKTIKELCDIVVQKRLEENAIEALWGSIKDLLEDSAPAENRHLALHFLQCLISGQLSFLGILRAHFFHVIQKLTQPEDIQPRLDLFKTLSENGRNLHEFEEAAGPFLLQLMPEVMSADKIKEFFAILINVIKYNAAYLDEDIISGLLTHTCVISNRNRSEEEIKLCLDVLDAIVCYSYLPTECLQHFIAALCRMVNIPKYSQSSWELMRKFLGTHLGHSSIYTMCCILQDRQQAVDQKLLRGAVFFVGMSLWGSRRVTSLKHTYTSVLPSFLQVLSTNSCIVAYEVVLSIHRLVKKYGKDLQHVAWNIILDILESVLKLIETSNQPAPDPRMQAELHDILSVIEVLHEHGQFSGCVSRFFNIIEMCAAKRPENSVSMLIDYHAQQIHTGKENWISNLYQLLDKYFRRETRTQIRVKALDKLSFVLRVNKHMHEEDLINRVVLPHLGHIETDKDPVVRKVAAEMLLSLTPNCTPACFMDIIALLEKIINKPLVARLKSPYPTTDDPDVMQQLDENHLVDIRTGLFGLIELFKEKLYMNPSLHCLRVYDLLISHMKLQYTQPRDYSSHTAAKIRKQIIEMLLQMRSDSLYRVGFEDKHKEDHLAYSPYITCKQSDEDTEVFSASPDPKESAAFLWCQSTHLDYTQAFSLFIDCLENDKDWQVLECVLVYLPLLLQNKTLVLSTRRDLINKLCHQICAMVNDRQLGFPEKLQSVPPGKFTRSDFHTFVFPVLSALVSYHNYLERSRQNELIRCLEFGLVSKCAKICTNSLRICALEMQDVMTRLLPSVLLQLSKISATVHMAIPVLAFLSSIVRLPKMYANFVETEYMSVFAIALPYTNPFKFSHYTVSFAHHVIAIWFIRCRFPFRKTFVKIIQRGLKANVLQQFTENSLLQNLNQDSSDRSRSSSYNEAALRSRRRMLSGSAISRDNFHPPVDNKLSQYHKELTETCADVMSRYTFANFNAIPNRSAVAEFLLKDGQSESWLLGNKLVTITTSGGGNNQMGLCDRCMALYQTSSNTQDQKNPTVTSGRRRHKSAIVSRSSANLEQNRTSAADLGLQQRLSLDDMSIPVDNTIDTGVQTGASLSEHTPTNLGLETEALESYLQGLKKKSTDGRIFQQNMCNCWCTGWAEVYIRAPSGNMAWMMRIENETLTTSLQDKQIPDLTMLFASVQNKKQPDISQLSSKIDSGSIGEEEYESLYDQHFPSDHNQDRPVSTDVERNSQGEEPEEGGLAIPSQRKSDNSIVIPGLLKRSNSSPSLLSSSSDTLDTRDSVSETTATEILSDTKAQDQAHKTDLQDDTSHPKDNDEQDGATGQSDRPKELDIRYDSTAKCASPQTLSTSPEGSESSSIHDEVSDLPAFRKARGHTISVVPQASGSRTGEKFSDFRSKTNAMKDLGRGGINPSFVFIQLYYDGVLHQGNNIPVHLPQSESITRAVKMLDIIFPYETHKIGVIYVGAGQTKDEKGILSNRYGSERYAKFVQGLGQLVRLSDCDPSRVYTGGLDIHGSDGQFAYTWQDESMHVIFHVATLMPNKESDPNCNAKKLHIGNDYVCIVYNESGEEYKIGTIKGQFNYVNIVIKPLDHESNAVTLQAKEVPFKDSITTDIADILGHKDTKVISDLNLAALVRQIAVNCDLASLVLQRQQSQPQDPFASNWLERLRQIRRIREKVKVEAEQHGGQRKTVEDFTDLV